MSESESVEEFQGIPAKKQKIQGYKQNYKSDWEKEFKWVQSSRKGSFYAWYVFCIDKAIF